MTDQVRCLAYVWGSMPIVHNHHTAQRKFDAKRYPQELHILTIGSKDLHHGVSGQNLHESSGQASREPPVIDLAIIDLVAGI